MYRRKFRTVVAIVLVISLSGNVIAQSGRGRQPVPPPQPKPGPATNLPKTTVLGIPEGGKLVKQDLDGMTSRYILRNGLTVIIRERHSNPLFSINVSVKAGAVNEPDEMAGMARLVRRSILQGSMTRSGYEFMREVARLGGEFQSESGYDRTTYQITAAAESYQAAIELLSDLVIKPAFKPDQIKNAAQKVMLEARADNDKPSEAAIEGLMSTAFTTGRLKRGKSQAETLAISFTAEQVQAFYHRFYNPANTVITIVGDVFSLQALGQIQLQFGGFAKVGAGVSQGQGSKPAAPAKQPAADQFSPGPEEPAQTGLRYSNTRKDISQSYVTIGYRLPDFGPDKDGLKDLATLEVLASVLGAGKGSRLWQGLREGQASRDKLSVAFETSADLMILPGSNQRASGLLAISMIVDKDRIDRAEAEYFREMERFRRELLSEGELQRARVMLEKSQIDRISVFESEADEISRYQIQLGDYRVLDYLPARIRAVTPQDIQQAAAKYMTLANTTVHELEPANAQARTFSPEKFAELVVTFAPAAAQPIKPEEVKPAVVLKTFPQGAERSGYVEAQNVIVASVPVPLKDFSVLRGPRAFVREDKSQPRLAVSVLFQGGRLLEDQTSSGMTELMLRNMLKSTTSRKSDLIALELENYGGRIEIVNEPDFYGFTLDVLSRNAEPAIKLLLDIIENPFFDKNELTTERDALLAEAGRRMDADQTRAEDLMWESLYPGHPYGLPRFGIPGVIKSATDTNLEEWHAKTIRKQFPIVMLVGDTDGSALVSKIFSDGLRREEVDKTLKVNIPTTLPTAADKIEQRLRSMTSQSIGIRVMGQSITSFNDLYALEMLGNIASCGKPSEELEWKDNPASGVTIRLAQRLASGAFVAQLSTLPENEQKAKEILIAELQKLAGSIPDDNDFETGRNASIGRYAISLQSHPLRALEYARAIIFGRKPSEVEAQPDAIRSIRKTDIRRMAESILKSAQPGRGVVRPQK